VNIRIDRRIKGRTWRWKADREYLQREKVIVNGTRSLWAEKVARSNMLCGEA
jgi:hypothetical protein